MTKQQRGYISTYERYKGRTLYQCYATPSVAKQQSYQWISREMVTSNGYGLTVLSYNTFKYTCAYQLDMIDPTTGVFNRYLVVHTPDRKMLVPYPVQ